MSARRALITGISGQDGSYLAELLCAEGLEVHGTLREAADAATPNLDAVRGSLHLHEGDLLERGTLRAIVEATAPDEIYHLAAPTFVPDSWLALGDTLHGIAALTGELIDAVRDHAPRARVVVASSREIFGPSAPSPQREDTPCAPASPYGVAKLAAHQAVGLARAHDALHLSSAILFNHESPRRDPSFITRKVTAAAAAISLGLEHELVLGDTAAVLASGVGHTVAELVELAFARVGLNPQRHVRVDPALVRPPEPQPAIGDPVHARERLGWRAQTTFEQLIDQMVEADLALARARKNG